MKHKEQTIFILAGESSGDLHGSHLMNAMKKINPKILFCGIGGSKMEKEGLQSIAPIKRLAVMGFWEVLKDLNFFLKLKKTVIQYILNIKPDKIILIDYPGFNLKLAKEIKSLINIPIIYYISPQLWAWKENRINIIKKHIDSLIAIFPFEVDWYKERGINIEYFGHPIIDVEQNLKKTPPKLPINNIALLPGSRLQEIKRHMPLLNDFIKNYLIINPNTKFIISKIPQINKEHYRIIKHPNISVTTNKLHDIFLKADIAIVSSGTATLECAINNIPMIVIYKMSALSWFITKHVVKIKHASIVNILNNDNIVPELIQNQATAPNITKAINKIMKNNNLEKLFSNYNNMKKSLDGGNAYCKTAQYILEY